VAPPPESIAKTGLSPDSRELLSWVLRSNDNRGESFAVIDKRRARVFVFEGHGKLVGSSGVLLGLARGDDAAPGIGRLAPADIPQSSRTTPAGRFVSMPGRNLQGEDVVWFDYDAGLAIHRLRSGSAYAARLGRLGSAVPDLHHVSAGCIVVPTAFYEKLIGPILGSGPAIVYVLPELRPLGEVFPALRRGARDDG
jgi:hypothetical protein